MPGQGLPQQKTRWKLAQALIAVLGGSSRAPQLLQARDKEAAAFRAPITLFKTRDALVSKIIQIGAVLANCPYIGVLRWGETAPVPLCSVQYRIYS